MGEWDHSVSPSVCSVDFVVSHLLSSVIFFSFVALDLQL